MVCMSTVRHAAEDTCRKLAVSSTQCQGLADIDHRVIGCRSTQETRVQHALDDAAGSIYDGRTQCARRSASEGSPSPLNSLLVRLCMMREKSSVSSNISGLTELSSAP